MILNFIYAFFATIGFSVLFNIPRKEMIYAGICGGLGWLVHIGLQNMDMSIIFTSFLGGLTVGLSSEYFAIKRKMPATVFVVPGMIPLVPGYGLYFSMLSIIEKNYDEALRVGFETLIVATVIASAIIISTSVGKIFKNRRIRLNIK
jgi:uncharacterized membrane protein YjjB (DUF3815 family)